MQSDVHFNYFTTTLFDKWLKFDTKFWIVLRLCNLCWKAANSFQFNGNDKETEDAITLNRQCPAFTILQARISGGEGIIFMNLRWQRQFTICNRISENCNAIYFTLYFTLLYLNSAISIRKLVDYVLRKAICLLLRKRRKLTLPRYLQFLFVYRLSVSQIQPPCSSPGVNPKQLIKGLIDLLSKIHLD